MNATVKSVLVLLIGLAVWELWVKDMVMGAK